MAYFHLHTPLTGAAALTDEITLLRDCYRAETAQSPVQTYAVVVLPHALHIVWGLPPGQAPAPRLSRLLASVRRHSRADLRWAPPRIAEIPPDTLAEAIEHCLWQPVWNELSDTPEDWPYSSVHHLKRVA
ncbi:MAG: hypothetical protein ACU0CO_18225 [Shimia sp.]